MVCIIMGLNWQAALDEIINEYRYEPTDEETIRAVEQAFRVNYDGPYTMSWSTPANHDDISIIIQFTNEADQIWWKLKYE